MHRKRLRVAVTVCALLVAVAAAEAVASRLGVLVLKSPNRTESNRTSANIDQIVVHVTEGNFVGSVRWLRNRASHGSSHYIVSRNGEVVQLVSISDVAWHAGNRWTNRRSVGIEHEGYTFQGDFTDAQYRASAQLSAYLAHRYGIPVDRGHVIGHHEVPNPLRPGMFGGANGHQDPGPHWDWKRYMKLIAEYSKDPQQPEYVKTMDIKPSTLKRYNGPGQTLDDVTSTWKPSAQAVVDFGATVKGVAKWYGGIDAAKNWRKRIYKAEFYVDGKKLWTDRQWPYAFRGGEGWDTRTVANGRHQLVVKGYGRRGYRSKRVLGVKVANPPIKLEIGGLTDGSGTEGVAHLSVKTTEPVDGVALYVDGRPVSRDRSAPYELVWDTTSEAEGPHELLVYARSWTGRRSAEKLEVVVANAAIVPDSLRLAWGAHDELLLPRGG